MTQTKLCITVLFFLYFTGCAVPGPKFIDLELLPHHGAIQTGAIQTHDLKDNVKLDIIEFTDKRLGMEKGDLGRRILFDKSQETYLVRNMDLASTLTGLSRTYLENRDYLVTRVPALARTLSGMDKAPRGIAHVLWADINIFECRAQKKGATTDMVLEMDFTFYLGNIQKKKLVTIPIALTLERTELTFTKKKLEKFINQAFTEILEKTLLF